MRSSTLGVVAGAAAIALVAADSTSLRAQDASRTVTQSGDVVPEIIHACYTTLTGVVYLIKQPGLQQACLSIGPIQHKEISWNRRGPKGDAGEPGPAGPAGADGAKGPAGDAGVQGPPGEKGPAGDQGAAGPAGTDGAKGPTGDPGAQGEPGPDGAKGAAGDKGPSGDPGTPGEKGPPGDKGPNGDPGAIGDKGPAGDKGEAGDKGPAGDQGLPGDKGPTGDQGPVGDKGPTGDEGPAGAPGQGCANGCVTTASLADGAVTNEKLATITAANKIANSATTATSANTPNTIVARDNLGSFSATEIELSGNLRLFGTGQIVHEGRRIMHTPTSFAPQVASFFFGIDAGPAGFTVPNENTGVGTLALRNVVGSGGSAPGSANTALGLAAGLSIVSGQANVAVGARAMDGGSGGMRGGVGQVNNVVVGYEAGRNIMGARNVVLGALAGSSLVSGSDNIFIGNSGAEESNSIRIGTAGTHTRTFVAGIHNSTVAGVPVHVDMNGQLGVLTSSARFKVGVRDIGDASATLYSLRPVSYRYRPDLDPAGVLQYGLIAEEVDRVAPELVVRDSVGRPYTVRYNMLVPLLVNEAQRIDREITALEQQNGDILRRIERLESRTAARKP
jgi:hypothetical protein